MEDRIWYLSVKKVWMSFTFKFLNSRVFKILQKFINLTKSENYKNIYLKKSESKILIFKKWF